MSAPGPELSASARPVLGRGFRLQYEPAQQAHVLLYPEGMVKLNSSAGEILRRCNGEHTIAQIIAELEAAFSASELTGDVHAFMKFAVEKHWLELRP